jgi:hypothetical protein
VPAFALDVDPDAAVAAFLSPADDSLEDESLDDFSFGGGSLGEGGPDAPSPLLPEGPASDAALALVMADDAVERSFLAQPEPLKWIAAAVMPLRIVPTAPQLGQAVGPLSKMP